MASSSSSSSSVPTVSSHPWKYNVFLSFRGEDTRKNFVDHLYSALVLQGIHTYKDDETLARGESIGPSLEKAIEESQIAVIIFSENYADSSWCLGELAYIMKCKDTRGTVVFPIFYGVEPSTLRKQKQKYREAFSKHELENKDKVESWRQALVDASNLSGWETKHMANGHESKAIKEIVETISRSLSPLTSSANEDLIGIEARVHDLISMLEIGSGGVRMIGIWGVGGGGKTTLALSVYEDISSKFDGCCFMGNIREESSKQGLEKLQKTILSNVLKKNEMEVIKVGAQWLPDDRLRRLKVLLVLDDVHHLDHLEMLAGSHGWFGVGSRIIITTRDENILNAHRVNGIYNIRLLNDVEAIKLLRKHAHRDYRPMADYELLYKDVVFYAGGLPLALKVLGCSLCDKDVKEWRSTLDRLKEIPKTDIVEKLKISYDGLEPVEKELFLHITCLFKGWYKDDNTMAMLDACELHSVIGVKVLIQKALITIDSNGRFDMHDLVQEMGHYIVRGHHPDNPEKHSRLWKKEDILKICNMDATKELDMIKAISVDSYAYGEIELPPIVANMKNLRWFYLRGNLASPFPTNFPPVELRCLLLSGISQKQLWNGYKHLPNLKFMQLGRLENLVMTPDFNGLPNLERLVLFRCPCLEKIHPSIELLQKLVYLAVQECSSLKMFPPIARLKKLETISFYMCPKLFNLSKTQQQKMENLPHLHLNNSGKKIASVKKFPANLFVTCWMCGDREVTKPGEDLIDEEVEECSLEETYLPHNNMNLHTLLQLFPTCFRKLNLSYCNVGDEDIGSAVWELPNLEVLDLEGNNFTRLNFSALQLPRLKRLNVSKCKDLVELSELPSSIAVVMTDNCRSLESFGDISNCKWLWKVSLLGENKLGPHGGDILLDSMLQGNALQDHFITVCLEHQMIPKVFVGRMYRGKTCKLHLPDDWCNDFCEFLICIVTKNTYFQHVNIVIKQEPDEDSPSEIWQESNEAADPKNDETIKYVGYVSFNSLRLLNSSYNIISFSMDLIMYFGERYADEIYVGVELVPRKSKVDEVQATDCIEFWDKESKDGSATFTIQDDSRSSINILWKLNPYSTRVSFFFCIILIKILWQPNYHLTKVLWKLFAKTTLALSVYEDISSKFDGCCFMGNIREESSKQGLEKLQKTILSNILKQNEMEVIKVGAQWLPDDRLRRIKVLIVLDDVDHLDHLKMLVGSHNWFGEGSRIIITTRNKHCLTAHKVTEIYNIRLLNEDEAIKLLHKHAPRDYRPLEDYEVLCKDVVSYAGGLPLALKVLGCFLCDQDIKEWKSTLARLKEIPETDIVEKLKISYDGLKPVEKELFLDIACVYKGWYKTDYTMGILDVCDFHPVIGVKVLIQKALITIDSDGCFDMHDLVQEMGHYIVRGHHPDNPEKHSRLWKKEDILKICNMDATKELDMIKTISFNSNEYGEIELLPPIIANMKNLRWFYQRGDIASPFPTNFPPVELRCLFLDGISQKQLWNGYKHLPNLKFMELSRLENLVMTPDFNGLPNLERLYFYRCPCLEKIHPSIELLQKLVLLVVQDCSSLKMFPPIARLKKLETISFSMCPKLFNLSKTQQQKMENLPHLHLNNSGKKIAGEDLIDVKVEECSLEEPSLPHTLLQLFPTCVRKLYLSYCNVGDEDIGSAVWELPNLEELILPGNNFTRLNFSALQLPRLKRLNVTNCKDLVELSELPSSIAVVEADDCRSLESFGDISNCKWLWKVSLLGENKLGPHGGDILLDSMLQGNALQDHFISVCLEHQMIPKVFVGRMYRGKTCKLHLPDDWFNDFCGFLICIVTKNTYFQHINIVIKQEPDEDSPSEIWQESNEATDPKNDETMKSVGYVSFNSLRLLNSSYNIISFSMDLIMSFGERYADEIYVGVELVPRKSKVDEVQATDCIEFWDKESKDGSATFTIQDDSRSSINILWKLNPYSTRWEKLVMNVDVNNDEEKEKTLRALDSLPEIGSTSVDMEEKKLTVIGYDVDRLDIIRKLKSIGVKSW